MGIRKWKKEKKKVTIKKETGPMLLRSGVLTFSLPKRKPRMALLVFLLPSTLPSSQPRTPPGFLFAAFAVNGKHLTEGGYYWRSAFISFGVTGQNNKSRLE